MEKPEPESRQQLRNLNRLKQPSGRCFSGEGRERAGFMEDLMNHNQSSRKRDSRARAAHPVPLEFLYNAGILAGMTARAAAQVKEPTAL